MSDGMRQIIFAFLLYLVSQLFVPKLWEKLVSAASPTVLRWILFASALLCVALIVCADPVYLRLAHPAKYPLSSTGAFALLLAVIGATGWWQFGVRPEIVGSPPDLLRPANDPTPQLIISRYARLSEEARTVAPGEMLIFLGAFAISTEEKSFVVVRLYGKDILTLKRIDSGLAISLDVWSEDGKIIATTEDNKFRVNPNNTLPIIRPDVHTLIVEDERKSCVLVVRFLNASTIKISGVFRSDGKYPVVIDDETISFGPLVIGGGVALHLKGRAPLEWPGEFQNLKTPENIKLSDRVAARVVMNEKVGNVVVTLPNGDNYSLFQLGGYPGLDRIESEVKFMIRPSGSY